ncbi:MAG: efflux RND transporter periplasmic adaptor subunit [Spirochaetes bacterium]|nr:efflux RND transporter periplasmic adaptor subunit [Spirochaetota bacterium]
MKKIIIGLLAIVSVFISCGKGNKDENRIVKVDTMKVKKEVIKENIYSIGTISYTEKVNITSKVMGKVEKIFVDVGTRVKKGSILLQIERFPLQLELTKAQAEYESAGSTLQLVEEKYKNALKRIGQQLKVIDKTKADMKDKESSLANVKRILERKKQLLEIGAITQEEYENLQTELTTYETKFQVSKKEVEIQLSGYSDEDIIESGHKLPTDPEEKIKLLKLMNTSVDKAEVEVHRAKVKNAKAHVQSIQLLLRNSAIRSPIDGIVAVRDIETGERVVNEQPLLVVMNIDHVYALLNIPESMINQVKKRNTIQLKVDALGDSTFTGSVHLISPIVDLKTRTVEVKGKFKNPSHLIKPGMFARANIYTGKERTCLTIPAASVITSESNTGSIFTLHKNNEVYAKKIEFKETIDNKVEVTSGLKENEIVIINNTEKLNDGDVVDVKK